MSSLRPITVLTWISQLVAAGILAMAGAAKLAGSADPVALFTLLGAEPWGRLLVGVLELLATALLLWPRTAVLGGSLGGLLMLGAIGTHLTRIGVTYGGDAGLFIMAWVVLLASVATVVLRRRLASVATMG
jgi:hypothetical protein